MTPLPPPSPPCNRSPGPVSADTDDPRRGRWARGAQATGRGLSGPLLPPASSASAVMTLGGAAAISSGTFTGGGRGGESPLSTPALPWRWFAAARCSRAGPQLSRAAPFIWPPRASTQPREEELPATSGLPSGSARPLPQTRPGKRREGAGGDAEAGSAGGRQGWRRGRREAGGGSPAYSRSRQEPNPSPPHRAEHRLMWHKCSINAHGLR
nr:uncharacterized protein LOC129479693 isoform X1 [Symphalangus syndactylus]XP_055129205.1 uncharacterized protein LOC129479693 isoform X1 [Symphalangus syndactylus]